MHCLCIHGQPNICICSFPGLKTDSWKSQTGIKLTRNSNTSVRACVSQKKRILRFNTLHANKIYFDTDICRTILPAQDLLICHLFSRVPSSGRFQRKCLSHEIKLTLDNLHFQKKMTKVMILFPFLHFYYLSERNAARLWKAVLWILASYTSVFSTSYRLEVVTL